MKNDRRAKSSSRIIKRIAVYCTQTIASFFFLDVVDFFFAGPGFIRAYYTVKKVEGNEIGTIVFSVFVACIAPFG